MGRSVAGLAVCAAIVIGAGCVGGGAGNDGGDAGEAGARDVGLGDGVPDSAGDGLSPDGPALPSNMGEGCIGSGPCLPGSPDCVIVDKASNRGICTRTCQQDDPATPLLNEHNCPDGFICSEFRYGEDRYYFCLQECRPSLEVNPCPKSSMTTCHPVSTRYTDLEQAVCVFAACADDNDCPVLSAIPCRVDGQCSALGPDAFCVRSEGRCARPGHCTPGGLCGAHALGSPTARVGDPCLGDFDCPGNGWCHQEVKQQDGTTLYRNGYCTIRFCSFSSQLPTFACPADSSCHHLFYGGLCHRTCDPAAAETCRGNSSDLGGDYECYSWDRLRIGDRAVTDRPVCEAARSRRCDSLGQTVDCTNLGLQNNPTHMRCRDPHTGIPLPLTDHRGVCLDDTASGIFEAQVDAGVDGATDGGAPAP